jgi:hypothetical protein
MGLLTEHEKFVKISLFEEGNLANRRKYEIIKNVSSLTGTEHMCVIYRECPTKSYCEELHPPFLFHVPPLA